MLWRERISNSTQRSHVCRHKSNRHLPWSYDSATYSSQINFNLSQSTPDATGRREGNGGFYLLRVNRLIISACGVLLSQPCNPLPGCWYSWIPPCIGLLLAQIGPSRSVLFGPVGISLIRDYQCCSVGLNRFWSESSHLFLEILENSHESF